MNGRELATACKATKVFGGVTAVAEANLHVTGGEVVGLLGPNGAGKTTLIRMLLGLEAPTSGSVRLFGTPPSRATRRRLGYVPQGLGLYEDLTAHENLAFAANAFGSPLDVPADIERVADELVRDLSLGVKRRIAFASALQHDPDLLILDEPTSGVGVVARAELWDTIRSAAERGAGVIVTTHHMDEAEECDRLVLMVGGAVVAEGSLDDIAGGTTAVVRAARWTEAFDSLESEGLHVALVGTSVRVPGERADRVRAVLRDASVDAIVEDASMTLDEAFVQIAARAP